MRRYFLNNKKTQKRIRDFFMKSGHHLIPYNTVGKKISDGNDIDVEERGRKTKALADQRRPSTQMDRETSI